MRGIVYRSTGTWYDIKDTTGQAWKARIKGVFKIDDISSTNPLAVGDEVHFEPEPDQPNSAIINEILPRKNYIARQSPSHRKQHHIVAANLDQALVVATIRHPRTSTGFLDRFFTAAEAYHVPAILVVNKKDSWNKKDEETFLHWQALYTSLGYPTYAHSIHQPETTQTIAERLHNKTTLVSGHSGVGKSSLLNALMPDWNLRTKTVSKWSGKGMHTTTFAEMFDLPGGGQVIDTPGIREFGVVDVPKEEISHYFPEMRSLIHDCQFNNCLHVNEPGCAVKEAFAQGKLAADRYFSYLNILDSLPENDWE